MLNSALEHRTCRSTRRRRPQKPVVERNPLVLTVDDDEDLTRVIKARLQKHRISVSRAASGREGLKLARSHRPNVIITDLGMDGGDGEYLLRRLNSRSSTAGIPVIVLSGLDDSVRVSAAYRQGAAAILRKPFQFDDLVSEIVPYLLPATEACDDHEESGGEAGPERERYRLERGHGRSFYVDPKQSDFRPHTFRNR